MPIILNTELKDGVYFVPKHETDRFEETPTIGKNGTRTFYMRYESN